MQHLCNFNIMAMVPNSTMIFIISVLTYKRFVVNVCLFIGFLLFIFNVIIFYFSKLIIFIAFSLKNSGNLSIQYSPLYTLCLFSILSDMHILGIKNSREICSFTFNVKFLKLFLHSSMLLVKNLRARWIKDGVLSELRKALQHEKTIYFHTFFKTF